MRKPIEGSGWYAYPGMIAVITTQYEGKRNAMASGWHTYVGSSPGMYGVSVSKGKHTHTLIEKSGVFGVNFLPAKYSELIQALGTHSGNNMDKFKEFNISYEDGLKTNVPILTDAYYAYECKVESITPVADHDWIIGKVLQRYKDEELFLGNGLPDLDKLEIPLYIGRSNYRVLNGKAEEHHHAFYDKED
ncbi:flavin reductase [Niallia circulans]|uniref:Flavin reductase n=1 Tax=Niallia circulans TaxID=1397 RepID=A0A553SRF3_NIACI|nr:flavin reductase family protein [Niallia circulans]TRZ39570.1 flavin reductase [Niallia circulans]